MSIQQIGCCGAYCGTCKELANQICKGCKIGYGYGERDINKAKCGIKKCCIKNCFSTCADCSSFSSCMIINEFYSKRGYKYGKYKEAIEFIKKNGYDKFLRIADTWKNVYGKYE